MNKNDIGRLLAVSTQINDEISVIKDELFINESLNVENIDLGEEILTYIISIESLAQDLNNNVREIDNMNLTVKDIIEREYGYS